MISQRTYDFFAQYFANSWYTATIILIAFFAIAYLALFIIERVFLRLAAKSKTNYDDRVITAVHKPAALLIFLLGIKIALFAFTFSERWNTLLHNMISTAIFATIAFAFIRAVDAVIEVWRMNFTQRTHIRIDVTLVHLFQRFFRVVFSFIGLILILRIWGVNISGFLAGAGIIGLILGLALKDPLGNIFSGISLTLDRAYRVGDRLKLDNGVVGTVKEVGVRSTRLLTYDNEMLIIPNSALAAMTIHNQSLTDLHVRGRIEVGVEHGSDVKKVQTVLVQILQKHPDVIKTPEPFVKFDRADANALIFTMFFWTKNPDFRSRIRGEVMSSAFEVLRKEKIKVKFVTRPAVGG